ncbi:UNVERIFIED_CONTAM: movement protein [Sesamum latifolium]|uniref:Movement protein n=1 Tax=Sesamum latifolium TaxID=2727402 RepID=A0AAW2U2X4_9LAMI
MTVSNKTMERIMRQDSNLSPYDGFRIGGIGRVLNQIGLNQRRHHIIYKVSSGEFAILMELTGNVMKMQLIPKEEILEELSKLREEVAVTMKWIHIGAIEVDFKRKDLMKEGNRPYSITYRIAYALSNTHHSDLFLKKEYIEIPRIFKEFAKQPVIGRYEGMLEIAGHEILVAGKENGSMTLGLNFLEDHKPWGRKESGMCTAKPGVFPKEAMKTLPVIVGRDFSQKILILNKGIRKANVIIGGAFGSPWQQGLIESDSFYEESEKEIINLKEALQEIKSLDISEESKLSLENVKRLIQRNFSENPLAWWDRNKIEATLKVKEDCKYECVRYKPIQMNMEDKKDMQIIIKEYINLGLIESGVSAYSSPDFLVRNHGEIKRGIELQEHIMEKIRNFSDVLKDKKHLQSFLGVVNFAGIFIKDLAKYRKDFRSLLKETESSKWKWEEIHTQRVRELKQVCSNLPKLAIPQDEDELVVYTDANDYRWAAVLMKKTTTGEEPCRYTGGLFSEQQAQVWHINEKEFFAVWKAFKKWSLFLLAKEFMLKVDNTNVKAFLKNKLESIIEKAQMEGFEANFVMLRLRHLRENLEELDREFGRLAVNAQVAGQVQRADLDIVQTTIRSSLVASTALWNALQEPIQKASPSVMTRELREHDPKHALRVQGSRPVAADSSTACTRPSPDSGEKATIESQGVQTSDDSSQPSTSGVKEEEISLRPMTSTSKANTNELISLSSAWQVYQRMWEKLISRKGVNPSKTIIEISGKYNRVWMLERSKPEDVREWYDFGALTSVHTMSPSFPKISKLSEWISGAVYDSWQNNPHLKRGDILELKFISAAPETARKGSHPAFHFIKLQRPDMVAFNKIKVAIGEAPLVSVISEDDISTRRAWGLWVCLTEMDKFKKKYRVCREHVRKEKNAHMGEQAACNRDHKDEGMQHVACWTMA